MYGRFPDWKRAVRKLDPRRPVTCRKVAETPSPAPPHKGEGTVEPTLPVGEGTTEPTLPTGEGTEKLLLPKGEGTSRPAALPSVSVVIPTLDPGRAFGTVLHRLTKQEVQPLEILVVDGGSQDAARHIVSQFPLARFIEAGVGPGPRAWNRACRDARGEVVAFLTQDALPSDDGWLRQLLTPFADRAVGGVYGRLLSPGHPLTEYRLARRYPNRERRRRARFGDPLSLDGIQFSASNAALRLSVWQGIRFNEHFPVAGDREWARQAMLASYTIVYQPAARVDRTLSPSLQLAFHDAMLAGWTSEYLGGEAGTLRSDPPHFMRRAAWHLLRRFRVDQLPYLVLEDMALRYGYGVGERLHEAAPSIRRRVAPEIANEAPRRYLTEYEQIA